ncbi:hypothetical protein [Pseudoalteromonas maricaloris]|uniref:hypothetical protein n=1 Tax=Pseudoalteromonas maricaloris TaxID=184924 RepID=UPI003C13B7C7
MFSDFLIEIITSAAVSAVLTGILIWMAKSWISERLKNAIKSEYDQKLETHKAQLKSQMDVEVEKLKSSLSIAAAERHVKFSKLHEERASVIAETYSLLKDVYITLQNYVKIFEPAGDKPREERREIASKAHGRFREYYPKKIIFLPQKTAEKLEEIDMELVRTFNEFAWTVDFQQGGGDAMKWNEIFERMRGEMKLALGELENEFRKLLGDES